MARADEPARRRPLRLRARSTWAPGSATAPPSRPPSSRARTRPSRSASCGASAARPRRLGAGRGDPTTFDPGSRSSGGSRRRRRRSTCGRSARSSSSGRGSRSSRRGLPLLLGPRALVGHQLGIGDADVNFQTVQPSASPAARRPRGVALDHLAVARRALERGEARGCRGRRRDAGAASPGRDRGAPSSPPITNDGRRRRPPRLARPLVVHARIVGDARLRPRRPLSTSSSGSSPSLCAGRRGRADARRRRPGANVAAWAAGSAEARFIGRRAADAAGVSPTRSSALASRSWARRAGGERRRRLARRRHGRPNDGLRPRRGDRSCAPRRSTRLARSRPPARVGLRPRRGPMPETPPIALDPARRESAAPASASISRRLDGDRGATGAHRSSPAAARPALAPDVVFCNEDEERALRRSDPRARLDRQAR